MKLEILYQDDDLIVVVKPAGMVVNNADSAKGVVTLQEWADEKFQISNIQYPKSVSSQASLISNDFVVDGYNKYDEFISRSGIVHRLDKETSGIILIAKNPESFINLQEQFKTGVVKKTYLTLLHGKLTPKTGEINAPVGRLPWNRMRFGVLPEGREAKTNYAVLSYKNYTNGKIQEALSLVEVYPQTGRTHQIRVHFQHLNYPVFADALYAGRKTGRDDRKILSSHFLHAAKISFNHPRTQVPLHFKSALPAELLTFLDDLSDISS